MVKKYLVTGASGYIAMHVIDQLLKQGHSVRGTIRSLKDKEKVDAIKKLGPVELVEGDLEDPESWKRAVKGIDIVLHVASPVPITTVMDEKDTIKQAVDGTVNVLKAAFDEGIRRVVVTSSIVTLFDDQLEKNKTYSDLDWGDYTKISSEKFSGYQKSKILAEKAAWDFYEKHKKDGFKLATVLPSFTIGPVLSSFNKSSVGMILSGFDKSLEKVFTMMAPICDVRDVALAHLKAAQLDEAVGHRFIIASDNRYFSSTEIFRIIEKAGYELNKNISDPLDIDDHKNQRMDNSKMRKILKIEPTDLKKSSIDTAKSFFDYGIVKK